MENLSSNDGKTYAFISYLTIIGTVLAFVLNNNKKITFASFHIRQNIGLNLLYFINHWIIKVYFGWFAFKVIAVLLFVLWVIGFMGMLKDEEKSVPVIGDHFQDWFKNI